MASSNLANQLRKRLQEENYSKWGFVIYRCTYESDDDWARFVENLNARAQDHLEIYEGLDLLDSLELTVRDDRESFDGATIQKCRDHFVDWVGSAEGRNSEQPNTPAVPTGWDGQPRYTFFIHVDKDSLESVVRRAPQPPADDMEGTGYVNMMDSKWVPSSDEETEIDLDGNVVTIGEGEEEQDWQRVAIWGLIPGIYMALLGGDLWYAEFEKPPHVWVES